AGRPRARGAWWPARSSGRTAGTGAVHSRPHPIRPTVHRGARRPCRAIAAVARVGGMESITEVPPLREVVAHAWFTMGYPPSRSLVLVEMTALGVGDAPGFVARID